MTLLIQIVKVQLALLLPCHQFTLEMLFPVFAVSKIVSWINYVDFLVPIDFSQFVCM